LYTQRGLVSRGGISRFSWHDIFPIGIMRRYN
jgi:hypothetical protein